MNTLYHCVTDRWSPTIGDPSAMGWVTVAAYGLAGLLCFVGFARSPNVGVRRFGVVMGLLLLALMVNKQLDLQSALTALGRCVSQIQGWYDERRAFQYKFILGVLIFCAVIGAFMFWALRRQLGQIGLALIGVVCLMTFVAVRAIGFHHFDAFILSSVMNVRMNWLLELGGIFLIALNALWGLAFWKRRPIA